jgi:hypothetical protein
MQNEGWPQLFGDWSWARGEGRFPIAAYSEYMPPPRVGQKPYGSWEIESPFLPDDLWGWQVSAHEQEQELTPGLADIGRQLIDALVALATGRGTHRIGRRHLENNPYWPKSLAEGAGALAQERYLFLSPLALAKTQDDQGHVRWTLFGGSDQGPAQGFWNSFFTAPGVELASGAALDAIRSILQRGYGEAPERLRDLRAAGFRILPATNTQDASGWSEGTLPAWTRVFLLQDNDPLDGVRYVLTFRPFGLLPEPIQRLYLTGKLHLLPFPGSLVFWGSPLYRHLCHELPLATQILLLQAITRHEHKTGIRVPQSGWLHRPRDDSATHDEGLGKLQSTFKRSHRWQRVLRSDDATEFAREDHMHTVLFSTHPDDVGLYGKPMARNAQIWSSAFQRVLHGPTADGNAIHGAIEAMEKGGSFGYRFFYPPMQAGRFALVWHRPLIAFRDPQSGQAQVIDNVLTGYLTASETPALSDTRLELWPRFESAKADTTPVGPKPGPRSTPGHSGAIEDLFADILGVDAEKEFSSAHPLTFPHSANRAFEIRYWETIADLAEGRYINKNSGDCIRDSHTQKHLRHPGRDLDMLGDHLLAYYRQLASETGMSQSVSVGDTPFRWQTDFDFPWMGGWLDNQEGRKQERNIVVVIPGKNRNEAVIMADHYDTAYMEDFYGDRPEPISDGSRLAAQGADDNHSATAALMLGAAPFMELSRKGLLDCDIWLVHLTGEEFPSDCLGARHLTQRVVEGDFRIRTQDGTSSDLSKTRVRGLYVLDMIAHNNDRHRDIFQIAPGTSRESLWLAYQAHMATRLWQAGTVLWNADPSRRNLGRGARSAGDVPGIARHLAPQGEVRLHNNPRSTLFNTDGQIFSDAGIPAVLFMENYDINRTGYHDSQDTMANIDLDYGAAVASIAMESVARAAVLPKTRED